MASYNYRAGDALNVVPCFLDDNGLNRVCSSYSLVVKGRRSSIDKIYGNSKNVE